MISPASLLKFATTYHLVARAAVPIMDDYQEMNQLANQAWGHIRAGEKIRMSGRRTKKTQTSGKYELLLGLRTLHFIQAANALKQLFQTYARSYRSAKKIFYQPYFVEMMEQQAPVVKGFLEASKPFINRKGEVVMEAFNARALSGEFGTAQLVPLATTVRKINNTFLGNLVLRPEDEVAAELEEAKAKEEPKPAKPSKPRKRKPIEKWPAGAAPGIIRGRLPKKKRVEEESSEQTKPTDVELQPMTPEELAQAVRDLEVNYPDLPAFPGQRSAPDWRRHQAEHGYQWRGPEESETTWQEEWQQMQERLST